MKLNLLLLSIFFLPFAYLLGYADNNDIMNHDIHIELFPDSNRLVATDNITSSGKKQEALRLSILNDIVIEKITSADNKLIEFKLEKSENYSEIIIPASNSKAFTVHYSGKIYHKPDERSLKETHAHSRGMISDKEGEGIYLPAGSFYPYNNDLCNYSVEVIYPSNLEMITSGKIISESEKGNKIIKTFKTEIPTDNITLVGGRYIKSEQEHKGVKFRIFTFADSKNNDAYFKAMAEYYEMYTELFGDYPYSSFDIVENFFATGFGMPNYTLITGMLMKMPWVFLSPGSLAHEFVHNWWGNSIYISEGEGNWCEALTTFSTNYYYHVMTGNNNKALEWRKKALIDLETLPEASNYPLKDFVTQRHTDDAAVGYSKGAFMFYELYKIFGKDHFFAAIQKFAKEYKGKRAGWSDIEKCFSNVAKIAKLEVDVNKIFSQWLNYKERPSLKLNVNGTSNNQLDLSISQDQDFVISVPLVIQTDKEEIRKELVLKDRENNFRFNVKGKINKVSLDPDYQVLRHLNHFEIPYTLASTLNNFPLLIVPNSDSKLHKISLEFADMLNQSGYNCEAMQAKEVQKKDWTNRPIVVLASQKDNSFFSNFRDKYPSQFNLEKDILKTSENDIPLEGNLLLINMTHPANDKLAATIIAFDNLDSSNQLRRLFHYMSYSMLMISQTKRGRPIYSQEIFPMASENNDLNYVE